MPKFEAMQNNQGGKCESYSDDWQCQFLQNIKSHYPESSPTPSVRSGGSNGGGTPSESVGSGDSMQRQDCDPIAIDPKKFEKTPQLDSKGKVISEGKKGGAYPEGYENEKPLEKPDAPQPKIPFDKLDCSSELLYQKEKFQNSKPSGRGEENWNGKVKDKDCQDAVHTQMRTIDSIDVNASKLYCGSASDIAGGGIKGSAGGKAGEASATFEKPNF